MKQSHLEELIRHITRSVLKEYNSMMSSSSKLSDDRIDSVDSDTPPVDAMTSNERKREERKAEINRQKVIKQKQAELDSKKKEIDFNRRKLDTQKRFEIPNLNKDLQKLKGAKI
jgi:hypothetical protein